MSCLYTITTCPLSFLSPPTHLSRCLPLPEPVSDGGSLTVQNEFFHLTTSCSHDRLITGVHPLMLPCTTKHTEVNTVTLFSQGSPLLNEVSDLDLSSPFEATELRIICQMTSFAVRQRPAKKSV